MKIFTFFSVVAAIVFWSTMGAFAGEDSASALIRESGVRGGLVVHVGCGSGELTTALRTGGAYVVYGLDRDRSNVAQARARILSIETAGRVSVARFGGESLPVVDGSVNLLVVSKGAGELSDGEVARALAPGGIAMLEGTAGKAADASLLQRELCSLADWTKFVRPVPPGIDEWTHFLHGPDGHVMSNDSVVGFPHHIQWIGTPQHSKSHAHLTTVNVMVSGGGRLFYIADVGLTALHDSLPSRWALIARDAFSGVTLWQRPLSSWQPYHVKDRNSYPADLHRRLVAGRDAVFATLSIHGPVSMLHAADGRILRTYADTEQAEDIIYEQGILYLSVNTGDREKINRRAMAYRHVEPTQKRIIVLEAATGRVLWSRLDTETDGLMPMTLAVKGSRLFFQNPRGIVCLDKTTGELIWQSPRPSEYFRPGWSSPTLVAFEDVVISADRQSGPKQRIGKDQYAAGGFSTGDIVVFSAETGKRLWSADCAEGCRAPTDVFRLEDRLWFGKTLQRNEHEYRQVHDIYTGEVLSEIPPSGQWPTQHHHRCYRDKATRNFILSGRTGVEFVDLKTGDFTLHNWIRGNCKFGVLPCNGLIYMPPEQCGCYVEGKLTGFHALAPRRTTQREYPPGSEGRLEKGPAFGKVSVSPVQARESADWPTYRADAARSGRAHTGIPMNLTEAWRVFPGGKLTPPVVAEGRLYVAQPHQHLLHAVNIANGALLWSFTAGAGIDSPPTVARGVTVFGCRDGWVYALRSSDGELAWRYRVAPADVSLVANERIESVWPVHGSVLVQDGSVYCSAGRSSYVDGGVRMVKLALETGQPLLSRRFHSRDMTTGRTVALYEPFDSGRMSRMELPGVLPDVLSSDGTRIWMRAVTFDSTLEIQEGFPAHLFSSMGFLDDSWWEISYWIYGRHMFGSRKGIDHAKGLYPSARIMVLDEEKVYGYHDETFRKTGLAASGRIAKTKTLETRKGKKRGRVLYDWHEDVPLHVFGLVSVDNGLFMAGPPKIESEKTRALLETVTVDQYQLPGVLKKALDTFTGKKGGILYAVDKAAGGKLMRMDLDTVPVFDGLIAADGRLFMSTRDGAVICLSGSD